jgi:ABC-type sulfate transport system substrate-binding protein
VIFGDNGYRPVLQSAARKFGFPVPRRLFTIQWLGGWARVDKQFFDPRTGIVTKIQKRKGGA